MLSFARHPASPDVHIADGSRAGSSHSDDSESIAKIVIPDTSDVDSDVLSSHGSEEAEAEADDTDENGDEEDDFFSRDDLYSSFIQSVFARDEENDRHSLCSGTDEDDEEYRPQSAKGSVGEAEPDDEDDDIDSKTITNRELRQLVDYSWRMVTSHAPDTDHIADRAAHGNHVLGSVLSEDNRSIKDKNLMSELLGKLLAGEEASGVCVDGIQVDSLRRLVARQMSMVLQVLVEMLLLCENRSSCDHECFRYLMELGNFREASVRKATLVKLQTKNIHKHSKRTLDECSMAAGVCGGSKTRKNASKDGASSSDSDDDPVVFHLTRSQVAAMATGRTAGGKHPPTSSVFDAPAFADINSLLLAIDRGRKIKTVEATVNICLTQSSSDQTVTMQPPLTQQQQWVNALNSLPEKVQCVLTQFHSRVWRCLIPRVDYPCRDAISGVVSDPTSLLSRSVFTPAEDDLLLRGLIYVGQLPGSQSSAETVWTTIQEKFLPSKDKQLLEFRYTQLINSDNPEGDKFKNYLRLMKDRGRTQRKWTHDEDIDLLKGFQVYGDKWPMINLYFLPHRSRRELKLRWATLLKESSKLSSEGQGPVRQDGTITSTMTTFLTELRVRGAQAEEIPDTLHVASSVYHKGGSKADADFLLTYPTVSGDGIRAIDTHIRASLRDADDDVLVDSESEEKDIGIPGYCDKSKLALPSFTGSLSFNSNFNTPNFNATASKQNILPSGTNWAPALNSDFLPNSNSVSNYFTKFGNIQSGFGQPFVSQIGFSLDGSVIDQKSALTESCCQSPQTSQKVIPSECDSQNSPRFFETSLGAFNFTVPYLRDGDSTRLAMDHVRKRSVDEMNQVQFDPSSLLLKDATNSPKRYMSDNEDQMYHSSTSLFQKVTQSNTGKRKFELDSE